VSRQLTSISFAVLPLMVVQDRADRCHYLYSSSATHCPYVIFTMPTLHVPAVIPVEGIRPVLLCVCYVSTLPTLQLSACQKTVDVMLQVAAGLPRTLCTSLLITSPLMYHLLRCVHSSVPSFYQPLRTLRTKPAIVSFAICSPPQTVHLYGSTPCASRASHSQH
jgi:hypothetical protein